jgi:hypothetical protein
MLEGPGGRSKDDMCGRAIDCRTWLVSWFAEASAGVGCWWKVALPGPGLSVGVVLVSGKGPDNLDSSP